MKFEISDQFYVNQQPIKIISGSIHYFRSTPEMWDDLLDKLKQLGCNTVETYVPWNLHQPQEGQFDFEGSLDIVKFLKKAQEHGLYAIVRIGPYICAEVDFGGLPWWLVTKNLRIRTNDSVYLDYVRIYFKRLIDELRITFVENGGNLILGQLENEYGSYANDKSYLYELYKIIDENNFTPPLVTSDGAWGNMLENGTMYNELGILPTVNFGSNAKVHFNTLQNFVGSEVKIPYMCMEFWCGWFTSWGHKQINRTDADNVANELKEILKRGSVNFYMFHGGTNFANISGANKTIENGYFAHTTSYDYDALLDERGNITDKYLKCRDVIKQFVELEPLDVNYNRATSYGIAEYQGSKQLFDSSHIRTIYNPTPLSIEELGYGYGYVNYQLQLNDVRTINSLDICKLTDRAYLKIDGQLIEVLEGKENYHLELNLKFTTDPIIDLVFECNPRINYGQFLESGKKGLLGGIFVNNHFFATGYTHSIVDLSCENLMAEGFQVNNDFDQHISKFTINIDDCSDTFIDTTNLGKGYAFINNHNLGRYFSQGPQYKLFIPKSYLVEGQNQIYIIDTELKPQSFELTES